MAATMFIMFGLTVGVGYRVVKQLHEATHAPARRQSPALVDASRKISDESGGKTLAARGPLSQDDECPTKARGDRTVFFDGRVKRVAQEPSEK